jgi:hypothetical protein
MQFRANFVKRVTNVNRTSCTDLRSRDICTAEMHRAENLLKLLNLILVTA